LSRDVSTGRSADLLYIHRKLYPPWFARRLHCAARSLVFDMDDALDLPPPHTRTGEVDSPRYRRNFEATVHAADLVLCGNDELASRLPHDRYELLPTPIDTERFRPDAIRPAAGPVLGWVGRSDNLGYLESLADPLRELVRRHAGLRLVVVADRPPQLPDLPVEFRRWSLETEISCFDDIAVGLMPLDDTPWARSKCAFKAIQYMALGIPAVASPVGMNTEVIRSGESGFLPRSDAEWVGHLDDLLSDRNLAARIATAGRTVVEQRYSLSVVSTRLVDILSSVIGE
jgi:glycosyltransferase involved in cell wall biosynthesis